MTPDATFLRRAITANFQDWFERTSTAGGGSVVPAGRGLRFIHWANADFCSSAANAATPAVIAAADAHARGLTPRKTVNLWLLAPSPREVERLVTAGFAFGFGPHYMAVDLAALREPAPVPGVDVQELDDDALWDRFDHPYSAFQGNPNWKPEAAARIAAWKAAPRRMRHLVAWEDHQGTRRPVGHTTLLLARGTLGVAGIYDVGVRPDCRNRGIGALVTHAACALGRRLGATHAILSASDMGFPVYRRLGFETFCHGQTWQLKPAALDTRATPEQAVLIRAIVHGRAAALDRLPPASLPALLATPFSNGATPLELAVRMKQPAVADWLLAHGAPPDPLSLWDLGRTEQSRALLASTPALGDEFRDGRTLLQTAILRNDEDLARTALAANPDLTLKDPTYGGTPLGWAHHFGRKKLVEMIEAHAKARQA